jgi:hypothetical protein
MGEVWPIGGGGASADRGTDGFRGRANRRAAKAANGGKPVAGVYFPA